MTAEGTDPGPAGGPADEAGSTTPPTRGHQDQPQRGPWVRALGLVEDHLLALVLGCMVVLPVLEIGLRNAGYPGITGSIPMVSHLTLLVGMLGGAVAARDRRLLSLSSLTGSLRGTWRSMARVYSASFAVAVCALLLWASAYFVLDERGAATVVVRGIPKWLVLLALPVGFGLIGLRQWWTTGEGLWSRVAIAVFGGGLSAFAYYQVEWFENHSGLALLAVLVAAALGLPIFAILGGLTLILLTGAFVGTGDIPIEHYDLVTNPILPTLPLFTLAGYFLAEGGASRRMIEVFQSLVGRIRGGPVIVTTLVCAFFTSFTGASGVTILALGGLLFPVLVAGGWSERTTLGLLTGAGSLGLLLAPCLPLILYAIVATNSLSAISLDAGTEVTMVSMENMFLAGLLPGLLLIVLTTVWAIRAGPRRDKSTLEPFDRRRALRAVWAAKWELALPVVAITALFGGFATPVEAAALTAAYAFFIETVVYRDLHIGRDVPRVMAECGLLVGGVLLILGVAMGLTGYLSLEQIPDRAVEWVTSNIESRWVFLLALNGILVLVGCLMDVFSAIVVMVPLIVPMGLAFGIDPVHLGIIFLANLELGYLTPPIGMNLFLASYRFKKSVPEVARAALPMLGVLAIGVLLITYLPFLSTFLPRWLG